MNRAALLFAMVASLAGCHNNQMASEVGGRENYAATRWMSHPDKGPGVDQIARGGVLTLALGEDGVAVAEGRIVADLPHFEFSAEGLWNQDGSNITVTWLTQSQPNYVPTLRLIQTNDLLSGVGEYPCCLGSWEISFLRGVRDN